MTAVADRVDPLLLEFARSRPEEMAVALAGAELRELSELLSTLPAGLASTVATRLTVSTT